VDFAGRVDGGVVSAAARRQNLVLQAACGRDDAGFLLVLGEVFGAVGVGG